MRPASSLIRLVVVVLVIVAAVAAWWGVYHSGGYAAAAGSNPVPAWGACLRAPGADAIEGSRPGIDPGSRLAFRTRVDPQSGSLVGWEFFGVVRDPASGSSGAQVRFSCVAGVLGESPVWTAAQ